MSADQVRFSNRARPQPACKNRRRGDPPPLSRHRPGTTMGLASRRECLGHYTNSSIFLPLRMVELFRPPRPGPESSPPSFAQAPLLANRARPTPRKTVAASTLPSAALPHGAPRGPSAAPSNSAFRPLNLPMRRVPATATAICLPPLFLVEPSEPMDQSQPAPCPVIHLAHEV